MTQQKKNIPLQNLPPSIPIVKQNKFLSPADFRELSTTSKRFSKVANDRLKQLKQQQYRKINSTLGHQLRRLGISTAYMAPEITEISTLPIEFFKSIDTAREELLPVWNFKKDRLVFSRESKTFFWLLSGTPFQVHYKIPMMIIEKVGI